ncbi:MAG: auracyanin family protein, partial [Bacteroidia bacterium]
MLNIFSSKILLILLGLFILTHTAYSQALVKESDYYRIETLPIPSNAFLEVGGLTFTDKNQLAASSRRGEVWVIDNPYGNNPRFNLFAHGLHEPLGLAFKDGGFYLAQRGELTRLEDKNNDGTADVYRTIYRWPLSGNYHEYSYGPLILPDGDMLLALNLGWDGKGVSWAKWRGWMIKVSPEGEMTPFATGFRSPAGFGFNSQGDIFYAENQGDWVGSGRMTHVEMGDFVGNPAGLKWANDPHSPVKLTIDDIPNGEGTLYQAAKRVPGIKPPSVWFPHTLMGISTSDILNDNTQGGFGPYAGQLFVGDQGHSKIMRVFQEKVNGVYQGICFPFLEGFSSGILRMIWGENATMFVGMTSRGWAATGKDLYGIQRVKWTGRLPFEMLAVRAQSDGFEIEFTKPVNRQEAATAAMYSIRSFTYHYHNTYGSPVVDPRDCQIQNIEVSEDGKKVRLYLSGIREGYIHEIALKNIKAADGTPLLHSTGYYTLNEIPAGKRIHAEHDMENMTASSDTEVYYDPAKYQTKIPAAWNNQVDQTITIGTLPGLKYDLAEFTVKAGSRVKIQFNNPDDMQHNLVIGVPGSVDEIGQMAFNLGLDGPNRGYIPDSEKILYHTSLLQPHSEEAIYF